MKTLILVPTLLLTAGAMAQSPGDDQNVTSEAAARKRSTSALTEPAHKDQIVVEKLTLSGIAVQAVKADNPLQLLNPAAPEKYGSGEGNVMRDLQTGRTSGLKIFSLEF